MDSPRITFGQTESNANDFAGSVVINAGRTLQLNTVHGLSSNHAVTANGALRLVTGPNSLVRIGALTGAGALELMLFAFVVQYLGLMAERWFFFAQANHPQNLYYQAIG